MTTLELKDILLVYLIIDVLRTTMSQRVLKNVFFSSFEKCRRCDEYKDQGHIMVIHRDRVQLIKGL